MRRFRDRHDAGAQLARDLESYAKRPDVVVLALPRGGVPIGYEIATRLEVPLDVLIVRKLGVPGRSELAMGAIASGDVHVVDRTIVAALRIPPQAFDAVLAAERRELERREKLYRGGRAPLDVRDKIVIVVDDGLATGATMRAAVESLRQRGPSTIVVAVPVAAYDTAEAFRLTVDDVICLLEPEQLYAVGLWYADFSQTTDDEVRELLVAAARILEARRTSTSIHPAGPHSHV